MSPSILKKAHGSKAVTKSKPVSSSNPSIDFKVCLLSLKYLIKECISLVPKTTKLCWLVCMNWCKTFMASSRCIDCLIEVYWLFYVILFCFVYL